MGLSFFVSAPCGPVSGVFRLSPPRTARPCAERHCKKNAPASRMTGRDRGLIGQPVGKVKRRRRTLQPNCWRAGNVSKSQ